MVETSSGGAQPHLNMADVSGESEAKTGKAGCGIIFMMDPRGAMIVDALVPFGPASRSGLLKRGDVLIDVDGVNVYRKPVVVVGPLLLGENGSTVRLALDRYTPEGYCRRILVVLERSLPQGGTPASTPGSSPAPPRSSLLHPSKSTAASPGSAAPEAASSPRP